MTNICYKWSLLLTFMLIYKPGHQSAVLWFVGSYYRKELSWYILTIERKFFKKIHTFKVYLSWDLSDWSSILLKYWTEIDENQCDIYFFSNGHPQKMFGKVTNFQVLVAWIFFLVKGKKVNGFRLSYSDHSVTYSLSGL